ncbi:MAG TPA: hypothetical protein VKA46_18920 [Gemmataceae bacterium]|nr:hypothetical protein [Gemmataceae bacterium]
MRPETAPSIENNLAARVELRPDDTAPPSQLLPTLARVLRELRDRERADQAAAAPPGQAKLIAGR